MSMILHTAAAADVGGLVDQSELPRMLFIERIKPAVEAVDVGRDRGAAEFARRRGMARAAAVLARARTRPSAWS